jgi:hypothetical protein
MAFRRNRRRFGKKRSFGGRPRIFKGGKKRRIKKYGNSRGGIRL